MKRIKFIYRWYDLWFGFFFDTRKRRLYCMIPFIGFYIQLDVKCEDCHKSLFKEPEDKPIYNDIDMIQCQECANFRIDELRAKHSPDYLADISDSLKEDDAPF